MDNNKELIIAIQEMLDKNNEKIESKFDSKINDVKRHMGVLVEGLKGDIKAIAEGHDILNRKLDNLTGEVGILKTDVSILKTDVSGLKADVSALKTDVSELKADVSVLKTDVSELKTDVSILKTDVSGLKTDVKGLKSDMNVVKKYVVGVDAKLNEHEIILKK